MRHIALCLDYDGCINTTDYPYPFTPKKVGDINTNTAIIDINSQLWDFVREICINNPDLEILTLVHFSARQSAQRDYACSDWNGTESYFLAMKKIEAHVAQLVKRIAPSVTVELNCLLMPDIYHNKEIGHTHKKALEEIDYSYEGRGMLKIQQQHDESLKDRNKTSYVFAHVHSIPADAFYYLDDLLEIHHAINKFYSNETGRSFIPKGVKVSLHHYDDGVMKQSFLFEITGTGPKCESYADILRDIFHKNRHGKRIFPTDSNTEFSKIYTTHMFNGSKPYDPELEHNLNMPNNKLLELTPLQASLFSGYEGFSEEITQRNRYGHSPRLFSTNKYDQHKQEDSPEADLIWISAFL